MTLVMTIVRGDDDVCCRRLHDETDSVIEGSLSAEVSLITLDLLEIVIQVRYHLLLQID